MTTLDLKNEKVPQTSQRRSKKINKSKEFDLNKGMSSVFERKKLIDDTCRLRNKN